jgi:hypothetical protein
VVLSRRACDKSERMKPRYTTALALESVWIRF